MEDVLERRRGRWRRVEEPLGVVMVRLGEMKALPVEGPWGAGTKGVGFPDHFKCCVG